MTADEQFDKIFQAYGGRLPREDVQPELMETLEDWLSFFRFMIERARTGKEFITGPIQVDYVGNPTVNAIATQVDQREFVGLFLGATMYIYDAFVVLATHPDVFKGVCEPKIAPATNSIKAHLLRPNPVRFLDLDYALDKSRWKLAQGATMITQFFLFGHELGHLIFGHLRYLLETSGSSKLVEYSAAPIQEEALRVRRVLEFDADMHGSTVSLNLWGQWSEAESHDVRFGLGTFYVWGFSLAVLFRLLDTYTTNPDRELTSTHPMPDARFAHAYICGLEEVLKRFPDREGEYKREVSQASKDVRHLWDILDMPAPSFGAWRENLGEDLAIYRAAWEELKDNCLDQLAWTRSNEIRASMREGAF